MEGLSLLIVASIIIAYIIICNEVAVVAKRKNLPSIPVFFISLFVTPAVGLLYIIAQLMNAKIKD
jgi:flagellar biosynthesis protein FliR